MFVIRRAQVDDVGTLLKLAKMVHFINLPPDKEVITTKITHSRRCFQKAAAGELAYPTGPFSSRGGLAAAIAESDLFMFVLEELESGACIGSSQLVSRMGGPGKPNYSFRLRRVQMFSEDIHTGTVHTVASLHADESGPTELGGLILQPSYRGHRLRLGRFLSLVRFHFIGLHRAGFSDHLLAEMMAEITADGRNLFWEACGRRFIPLSYDEADRHCQISREFIPALLPKDDIYLALLPPSARDAVGKVGPETVAARRMLENLGFEYRNFVDPFDGGPHMHALTDEVEPIHQTVRLTLGEAVSKSACDRTALISVLDADGEFRAVEEACAIHPDGTLGLTRQSLEVLQAEPGTEAGATPMDKAGDLHPRKTRSGTQAARSTKPSTRKKPATPKRNASKKPGRSKR